VTVGTRLPGALPAAGPLASPLRLLVALTRRLPVARYRASEELQRILPARFQARLAAELGGLAFVYDHADFVARTVLAGWWEPAVTLLVRTALGPGMTFVDVGAQWGYYTLVSAVRVGRSGRVLALEPHPELFGRLADNVARNDLTWVALRRLAVGAGTARQVLVGFEEHAGNQGGAWLRPGADPAARADGRTEQVVEVRALDDLAREEGLGTIDLVKMDIEGGEAMAVRGMAGLLSKGRIRRLVIEVHGDGLARCGGSLETFYEDLESAGYRGFSLNETRQTGRRIAYGQLTDARAIVKPLERSAPIGNFVHQLWLAPGASIPGQPG
jgi:FkbM family methyltransferase